MNNRNNMIAPIEREYLGVPFRAEAANKIDSFNASELLEASGGGNIIEQGENVKYRQIQVAVTSFSADASTGDKIAAVVVPFDGKLVFVHGKVAVTSSSGNIQVTLQDEYDNDILAGSIIIEAGDTDSFSYAYQPYVKTNYSNYVRDDIIYINLDSAGTDTRGLIITMYFVADKFYSEE